MIYYPQVAVILRVTWEDFGSKIGVLQKITDITVSARNVIVERNDYSEADTVKLRIDYKSFPFDPRCIRACGISVFMENRKKIFNLDNSLHLIEPSSNSIAHDGNKVFIGFADESTIKFDDSAREISMEGRDYTGLFIDTKRVNTEPIALSKPIDQIMSDLILEQKATEEIKVENRTGDASLPTLASLAPDFNATTSVKNIKRRETYWDIMQDILSRIGLLGFIELDIFVITRPQNIYEKKDLKQFIYGGNIKDLEFKRKLGRAKNFNVKVVSFNSVDKKVEEALIPEQATDPRYAGPRVTIPQLDKNGKKIDPPKDADFLTFPVKSVTNKEALIKIGESIFEELSRQQIEGSLSTMEMEIPQELDTGTKIISFNKIRNGTAIRIYLSNHEIKSISSSSQKGDKMRFLIRRGYRPKLAEAFAESLDRINTAFYTKAVKFEIDQDNGFSMHIDFINFIDIDSSLQGK